MNDTSLLLKAYYEALYELLQANKESLAERVEGLLAEELAKLGFADFDAEKVTAYKDACLAFVDERLEMYNPIGFQYTFDNIRSPQAIELELQLSWYDSRQEFKTLVEAARAKTQAPMAEGAMQGLVGELIKEARAFPDKSIIAAYQLKPALGKLPDYVVAQAIEQIIR